MSVNPGVQTGCPGTNGLDGHGNVIEPLHVVQAGGQNATEDFENLAPRSMLAMVRARPDMVIGNLNNQLS